MPKTDLPYAADAELSLSSDELGVLRRQYDHEGAEVTTQTKFNYAWGLIKSKKKPDQQLGVQLLAEIFQDSPERRRECLYYLALGHFKLGEYTNAKEFNNQLLEREPDNLQALNLKHMIEENLKKEGVMGMLIASGVFAVGAVVVGSLLGLRKKD
ncbi:2010_t:CDS:2 [Acaulospora morrowiae]|uniref:Mitochondrial fission 1 protein n=1 Tax=Acaulospora morrowiae TaxID=94023 RepID=A0A9N8ZBF3_9GLOM|nr:2010_t:CDS:2 [Acaulospora morrowiae]